MTPARGATTMAKAKAIRHRGVKIVPIKITRYEVRDITGKVMATFSTATAAKAWVRGYQAAADRGRKAVDNTTRPATPPRTRKANGPAEPPTPDKS